jgi:DNA gyrase subunit A
MREVTEDQELVLATEQGMTVRIPVDSISCIGRNTQGVRLINTSGDDRVSGVVTLEPQEEGETEDAEQDQDQE